MNSGNNTCPANAASSVTNAAGGGLITAWRKMPVALKLVLLGLLLAQIPLLFLIGNRLFLDFDNDGAPYFLMHLVERVRINEPIYLEARPGAASPTYAPLSIWLIGFLSKAFGASLVWPRIIECLFVCVFLVVMGLWIWKITERNLFFSIAAPLLYLSSYGQMSPWYMNIIPVNAMHIALAVLGFFLLTRNLTPRLALAVSLIMCLATITKQTGLGYVAAAGVYVLIRSRKLGLLYFIFAGMFLGLFTWYMDTSTNGYFSRAVIKVAGAATWMPDRIWNAVLFPEFLGWFGPCVLMAAVPLVFSRTWRDLWQTIFTPHYVMAAAGLLVALISEPKIGSGATQAIVGYIGVMICACLGLTRLAKFLPADLMKSFTVWFCILQATVLLVGAVPQYRTWLIDEHDRNTYRQVTEVFRAGKTCFFGFPFLPKLFGQPENGQFGDELMQWKNHRYNYGDKPAAMNEPLVRQEYDYVILPMWADVRNDPSAKAVIDNYVPIYQIPGHPRGPAGGNMRYPLFVCRAKRLMPAQKQDPNTFPSK